MNRYIAVDAGKFDTKAVIHRSSGETQQLIFRTKMSRARNNQIAQHEASHLVTYEGVTYKVGADAEDSSISHDNSKMELIHKVTTYTAIGLFVDNGDLVNLAIGCPISIYDNRAMVLQYKDFIAPEGKQVTITIDDNEISFGFGKVVVFPESSGAIFLDPNRYGDQQVGVIDIGGLNVNCSIYDKLIPLFDRSFTDQLGSMKLMGTAQQELERAFGTQLDYVVMNELQRNGRLVGKYRQQSEDIFGKIKKDHVERILEKCSENNWKLDFIQLAFVGGTAAMLKPEIEAIAAERGLSDNINFELINDNSGFVNAKGFLNSLLLRCGVQK